MFLSKTKCWYSNNCLYFLMSAVPLVGHGFKPSPYSTLLKFVRTSFRVFPKFLFNFTAFAWACLYELNYIHVFAVRQHSAERQAAEWHLEERCWEKALGRKKSAERNLVEWQFKEWHFKEWHFKEWHFEEWHFKEWHFKEWHF
jgi:hypothetical protein